MDISSIQQQGEALLAEIKQKAQIAGVSTAIKQTLQYQSVQIQNLLNQVFMQTGIISQDQVDYANSVLNNAKKTILAAQVEASKNKIALFTCLGIALISIFLILRNKENKTANE
jgi:lipopolysaccharide export LptBFGC system permease protein LptF